MRRAHTPDIVAGSPGGTPNRNADSPRAASQATSEPGDASHQRPASSPAGGSSRSRRRARRRAPSGCSAPAAARPPHTRAIRRSPGRQRQRRRGEHGEHETQEARPHDRSPRAPTPCVRSSTGGRSGRRAPDGVSNGGSRMLRLAAHRDEHVPERELPERVIEGRLRRATAARRSARRRPPRSRRGRVTSSATRRAARCWSSAMRSSCRPGSTPGEVAPRQRLVDDDHARRRRQCRARRRAGPRSAARRASRGIRPTRCGTAPSAPRPAPAAAAPRTRNGMRQPGDSGRNVARRRRRSRPAARRSCVHQRRVELARPAATARTRRRSTARPRVTMPSGRNPGSSAASRATLRSQQPGAGEQHDRDRDLRHHQHAMDASARADRGPAFAPPSLSAPLRIRARHQQAREQPEPLAVPTTSATAQARTPRVHRHLREARHVHRRGGHDRRARRRTAIATPSDAARRGQQQALGQQLAHQAPAARADRRTDRHLARPRRRRASSRFATLMQAISSSEADGGEQHEQRRPDPADDVVVQRR